MRKAPINSFLHEQYKQKLREYNKILKTVILSAKKMFFESEFNKHKNDIRKTWKTIKNVIDNSSSSKSFPVCISKNNSYITKPLDIINELNSFFTNIGRNMAPNSNKSYDEFSNYFSTLSKTSFKFKNVADNDIQKMLSKLKPKLSCGIDDISSDFLKDTRTYFLNL